MCISPHFGPQVKCQVVNTIASTARRLRRLWVQSPGTGPFCLELACMGSLRVLWHTPAVQSNACEVNWKSELYTVIQVWVWTVICVWTNNCSGWNLPSPGDNWDRLQQTPATLAAGVSRCRKWNGPMTCFCTSSALASSSRLNTIQLFFLLFLTLPLPLN